MRVHLINILFMFHMQIPVVISFQNHTYGATTKTAYKDGSTFQECAFCEPNQLLQLNVYVPMTSNDVTGHYIQLQACLVHQGRYNFNFYLCMGHALKF